MSWVCTKQRLPPKEGWYQVIKFHSEIKEVAFFKSVPPRKSIEYMQWTTKMKLESDDEDRCVYVKYKCFARDRFEETLDEIIYWYELDAIPEQQE